MDVNEEGTGRGNTAVQQVPAVPIPPTAFLFLIRDVQHGTILFMGRVENPK